MTKTHTKLYHYTYVLKRVSDGAFYIGVRTSKCLPKDDTGYMSSSRSVRNEIKAGIEYRKKVLRIWPSRKKAVKHEVELHSKHDVARNPKFLNRAKQTTTGFDRSGTEPWNKGARGAQEAWNKGLQEPEHLRLAKSIRQKGRRHREESKQSIAASWTPEKRALQSTNNTGVNNPRYGAVCTEKTKARMSLGWSSELRSKKSEWATRCSPTKDPRVAAKVSMALKGRPKSAEHRANMIGSKSAAGLASISARMTGSTWITNGKLTKRLAPESVMPSGFKEGKLPESRFSHPKFPGELKMKSHWSRWARQYLEEQRVQKFMNQLQKEA